MGFEIEKLDLEGMLLIHAHVANDNRGFYRKNFERNIFAENGLDFSVTEWSDIYSHKGAIRGLHFQTGSLPRTALRCRDHEDGEWTVT